MEKNLKARDILENIFSGYTELQKERDLEEEFEEISKSIKSMEKDLSAAKFSKQILRRIISERYKKRLM